MTHDYRSRTHDRNTHTFDLTSTAPTNQLRNIEQIKSKTKQFNRSLMDIEL